MLLRRLLALSAVLVIPVLTYGGTIQLTIMSTFSSPDRSAIQGGAINDNGVVAFYTAPAAPPGYYFGVPYFRDANGAITPIGGYGYAAAVFGINNSGTIVGARLNFPTLSDPYALALPRGYVRQPDGSYDQPWFVDYPYATAEIYDINNLGDWIAIGNDHRPNGYHGYGLIFPPWGDALLPSGINDSGQIVGYILDGNTNVPIRREPDGSVTNLSGVLSGLSGLPLGILNSGQIFGSNWIYDPSSGTVDTLDPSVGVIFNMNNSGQVFGRLSNDQAFIGTITPEPSSVLLFATGGLFLAVWGRRRFRCRRP
jgi:hypothetical protein